MSAATSFDENFQLFHVNLEETRLLISPSVTGETDSKNPGHLAQSLSHLRDYLETLRSSSQNDVHHAITEDCQRKLTDLCTRIFSYVINDPVQFHDKELTLTFSESPSAEAPDGDQPAIAFIAEFTILTHVFIKSSTSTITAIIQAYASYQRRVLRQRSKPPIAYLAELRRSGTLQHVYLQEDDDDSQDDDVETEEGPNQHQHQHQHQRQQKRQPHAHTITVILGEASQLLQPLSAWRSSLPSIVIITNENNNHNQNEDHIDPVPSFLHQLCSISIQTLHDEAQKLISAVIKWLDHDNNIKEWTDRSVSYHKNGSSGSSSSSSSSSDLLDGVDVASLERICNELSFLCQVLTRYIRFTSTIVHSTTSDESFLDCTTISTLLSQQCGHYATLEDYFASISLLKAKIIASPVPIITGEKVYVPSIVEDAFYISQRALERANETMSQHAIITVMHRIEEMWECNVAHGMGNVNVSRGVYDALIEGGAMLDVNEMEENDETLTLTLTSKLTLEEKEEEKARLKKQQLLQNQQQPQNQGGGFYFASAFLSAIDQDIGEEQSTPVNMNINTNTNVPTKIKNNKKKNPESQLLSQICLLNGISSASSACSALSSLLHSFLPHEDLSLNENKNNGDDGNNKLLKLSEENLRTHAKNYALLLADKTRQVVIKWCGPTEFADLLPVDRIQTYIEEQSYYIGDHTRLNIEEEKVHTQIVKTLEGGRFVREALRGGRCEGAVLMEIVKTLTTMISEEIFLKHLLHSTDVRFTDWGALLLSTQVRTLENLLCSFILDNEGKVSASPNSSHHGAYTSSVQPGSDSTFHGVSTSPILERMERLAQAVTILQLEKPSDWISFRYGYEGSNDTTNGCGGSERQSFLDRDEVRKIMKLRVDFSEDAVNKACE